MPGLPPVILKLTALNGEFNSRMGEAKAELSSLETSGNKHLGGLAGAGKVAALGVIAIGVAAIAAGGVAVKMASDFQESTTQIVTGAGESEANIDAVRKGILAMAGATGTMPEELSKGFYLIASAGYHGAQGLDVLKAAAMGAKVGGAEMAVVANGLTTALTDYHIPASRANAVTSAMVATVAAGKMKMQDLANSLGMVMPKAASLGVSFQDVNGALATMTATGMSTRRASMNLANTIMSLGAPSKGAADALKNIGLSAQQVKDDLSKKGLAGTLAEITEHVGTKFPKGSVAGVTALKSILGGTTGFGTALALTGSHAKAFADNVKSIGGALNGQSKEVQGFSLVQKDLSFQVDAAKSTMSAWGITLGTALLPIVTKAMVFINTVGIPAVKALAASFTTNVLPVLKQVAAFITSTVIPALMTFGKFLVGTVIPGIVSFGKFIYNAREPLAIIAGVITALFIPALIRAGAMATASALRQVAAYLMSSAASIANTVVSVAQFAIQGAKWIWMAGVAVVNAAIIAAQWLIAMGPIGLVIAAVVGLGVLIATHMDQIKGWIGGAWDWIKNATETAWNWIKTNLKTIIEAIIVVVTGPIGLLGVLIFNNWDKIKAVTAAAFNWVKGFLAGIWSGITGIVNREIQGIRNIIGWFGNLGGLFSGWFHAAYNAASGALGSLLSFVTGLPGRILSGLGNLGSLLLSSGKNIVQGLIDGIKNMAGALIHALIGLLPDPLKKFANLLGLHSPSTVFAGYGKNIVQGLIEGIEGSQGALTASMASLAETASKSPSIAPLVGVVTGGGMASGGSGPALSGTVMPRAAAGPVGGGNGATSADIRALGDRFAAELQRQARTLETMRRQMAGSPGVA